MPPREQASIARCSETSTFLFDDLFLAIMKRKAVRSCAAALAIVLLGVAAWLQYKPHQTPVSPPLNKQTSEKNANTLKVPSSLKWNQLSEKELREFSSHFDNRKSPGSFKHTSLVELGQSLVTEGYEARPGEFVFSKLTPSLTARADGTKIITVNSESFKVSLDGQEQPINSRLLEIPANGGHSSSTITNEGTYRISIKARMDDTYPLIGLDVSGDFKPRK